MVDLEGRADLALPGAADDLVVRVADALLSRGERLAVAESCTGGRVAARLASVPGASRWLWGSAVVYTAGAKGAVLGLRAELLERRGTVSEATTVEMARAVRELASVEWSAAVTCWAGPEGGTDVDPVGTAYLAVVGAERVECRRERFVGERSRVCAAATSALLEMLCECLSTGGETGRRA